MNSYESGHENTVTHSTQQIDPIVHRLAVVTCVVALLPISIGALVTTLKAGMAFADWPTSDGHNMLLYPWLQDLRNTDRFTEHGHRLAGMLIGVVAIILVVVTFVRERSRWVRNYSLAILVAVIAQGLLGGARVLMDASVLAMVHSITGALFFTQCALFADLTRRSGDLVRSPASQRGVSLVVQVLTLLLPVLILGQYLLGGMFRHLGRMMFEHLAGAAVVAVVGIVCAAVLLRSGHGDLRRSGRWLLAALLFQLCLGAAAWVTKLNVPALGWVATTGSLASIVFRSLHTVGGMFLLASAAIATVRVVGLMSFPRVSTRLTELPSAKGGLA